MWAYIAEVLYGRLYTRCENMSHVWYMYSQCFINFNVFHVLGTGESKTEQQNGNPNFSCIHIFCRSIWNIPRYSNSCTSKFCSCFFVVPRSVFILLFTDNATLFASLIARTAQDIDVLIDSLPSEELTPEKQVDTLRKLELENQQSAERLSRAVKDGGKWLLQCWI